MIGLAFARWGNNPSIEILGNPDPLRRVGIISFNIKDPKGQYLHPRFITTLLNDLFGIQSRAGCSCAGPYGHQLLGIDHDKAEEYRSWITRGYHGIKPGWCRVGFHYVFDQAEVEYLLDCVEFVAELGHLFIHQYQFDAKGGAWRHKQWQEPETSFSLKQALSIDENRLDSLTDEERRGLYRSYLQQARELAQQSSLQAG